MQIQGIRQNVATPTTQLVKNNDHLNSTSSTEQNPKGISTQAEPSMRSIDMHNISPNEYNELVRSGKADLPVPIPLPGGQFHIDGKQAEMGDVKMDYIAQIEQSIKYSQSIDDTDGADFLLNRLTIVEDLNGQEYESRDSSKGINITV
jgi:hypothetical protein